MLRKMALVLISLTAVLAAFVTTAVATPPTPGGLTVETARGELAEPLNVNTKLSNGGKIKLQTHGSVELITQRIEALPGATFGWHTHPGETVVIVVRGTLTFYHDEHCSEGVAYGTGSAFQTSPDEVHLARNNGSDTLVVFATYFAPHTTPPAPVRLDADLPGPGCPQ